MKNRRNDLKERSHLASVLLLLPLFLTACHTIEGAGTDIKQTGKAIEHSAERNKGHHHHHLHCPTCSCCDLPSE